MPLLRSQDLQSGPDSYLLIELQGNIESDNGFLNEAIGEFSQTDVHFIWDLLKLIM